MARPIKNGLDYFPMDVDFFADKKIKILRARFGSDGVLIYLYLLCEIYKNGYYIKLDEDYKYIIQEDLNLKENVVSIVMQFLFNRSLLTEIPVNSDTYITSKAVQRRFQEAVKSRKKPFAVNTDLWILDEEETIGSVIFAPKKDKSRINPDLSQINPDKSGINSTKESKEKKSKVKESKGEKSKEKTGKADFYSLTLELFSEICKSLPKPQEITPERKRLIDCGEEKLKEYGKTFEEFFKAVEESDFLSGRSGKWTGCSFDWILKPHNMVKILEGNYTNQEECSNYIFGSGKKGFQSYQGGTSYDIDEYERDSNIDNWY
ncbi:MAG: DUF4373 domain-containing protein [Ruminococcus sp.]